MHGNMVFSRDSIFPTPQQSGCLFVCSVFVSVHNIMFCVSLYCCSVTELENYCGMEYCRHFVGKKPSEAQLSVLPYNY